MRKIRKYSSPDALADGLASVWKKELIPNILKGLSASVYTQVSDIEDELNGLLTYDRKLLKVNAGKLREMNRKLAEVFAGAVQCCRTVIRRTPRELCLFGK